MRLGTRVFLLSFLPCVILMMLGFSVMQKRVQSTVRQQLRLSLHNDQLMIARLRARSDLQNSRFLNIAGENASLKAGLQLLLTNRSDIQARETVEEQLSALCMQMGFDYLAVAGPEGGTLAGVIRVNGRAVTLDREASPSAHGGLTTIAGNVFQIACVPIDQGNENLGWLSVGELFDISGRTVASTLSRNGRIVASSIPGLTIAEVRQALRGCGPGPECELKLKGQSYLSLAAREPAVGDEYVLRSFQSVDAAVRPVQVALERVVLGSSAAGVVLTLLLSAASSRSITKPIRAIHGQLQSAARSGSLPVFDAELSRIREIRELIEGFERAARDAQGRLQMAYIEFVGSLADALDARDCYTAGHSHRVSELSLAIARAMGLEPDETERIRIGALLHDIGKIGVADKILQKPGRLSEEEFSLVKQHPQIGRKILERVLGLAPYLAAVELHHENWDGSGYPHGQMGEETPLEARIIHVSDAYDAMTTDRPYRHGMSHAKAMRVLRENAGTQFDPLIVTTLEELHLQAVDETESRDAEWIGAPV